MQLLGENREKILGKATSLIAKKGFYGTKTRDIAREVGITEPTIYAYFDSKDDILFSIFEEGWAKLNANLEVDMENFKGGQDFWGEFEVFFDSVSRFVKNNPDLVIVMVREYFRANSKLKAKIILSMKRYKLIRNLLASSYRAYSMRNSMPKELEGLDIKVLKTLLSIALELITRIWGIAEPQKVLQYVLKK